MCPRTELAEEQISINRLGKRSGWEWKDTSQLALDGAGTAAGNRGQRWQRQVGECCGNVGQQPLPPCPHHPRAGDSAGLRAESLLAGQRTSREVEHPCAWGRIAPGASREVEHPCSSLHDHPRGIQGGGTSLQLPPGLAYRPPRRLSIPMHPSRISPWASK